MTRKAIKLQVIGLMLTMVAMLFMGANVFADEIDTPEDDSIVEEYDEVYGYYYNYHDTMFYPTYDAFYLRSSNYEDFLEEIEGYNYIYGTIKATVYTGYSTAPFRVALKNWYSSPNEFDGYTLNLTDYYSTHTYIYYFTLDLTQMSNSLCVYFTCSTGNPRLYDVEVYLSYGYVDGDVSNDVTYSHYI